MKMIKKWFTSKTLWTNFFAAVALFAQSQFGYVIDPATQGYIIVVINFILRFLTNKGIL